MSNRERRGERAGRVSGTVGAREHAISSLRCVHLQLQQVAMSDSSSGSLSSLSQRECRVGTLDRRHTSRRRSRQAPFHATHLHAIWLSDNGGNALPRSVAFLDSPTFLTFPSQPKSVEGLSQRCMRIHLRHPSDGSCAYQIDTPVCCVFLPGWCCCVGKRRFKEMRVSASWHSTPSGLISHYPPPF